MWRNKCVEVPPATEVWDRVLLLKNHKHMLYRLLIICLLCITGTRPLSAQSTIVLFHTDYGDFKVMLYDFTPRHRDLFLQEIAKGTYHNALFNRVVKGFVVQGGEYDDDILAREKKSGQTEGRLAPEFDERAFHKIGALGAGRDDNPEKASFLRQIYFVAGSSCTEAQFDSMAVKYRKRFTPERRQHYLDHGGQPRLDGDYTVFGEVIEGLDVLLEISRLPVESSHHFPERQVKFRVEVL